MKGHRKNHTLRSKAKTNLFQNNINENRIQARQIEFVQKEKEKIGRRFNRKENFYNKEMRSFYQEVKKERRGYVLKTLFCRREDGEMIEEAEENIDR